MTSGYTGIGLAGPARISRCRVRRAARIGMALCALTASISAFGAPAAHAASLTWSASDPALDKGPYLPTYAKQTPAQRMCPRPSGSTGRAANPFANAVAYASPATSANFDAVTSLAPKNLALGQIVPFQLVVDSLTTADNPVVVNPYWLTKTTSGGDFGYDPKYGVLCAFVDTADPGTTDPGADAKVNAFSSSISGTGTKDEQIDGKITISGLQSGDRAVVEVWVVLKPTIPSGVTGNVQSGITDATHGSPATKLNVGNQTVPLLRPHEFLSASADVSVTKTDTPDPATPGGDLTYTLVTKNLSTDTVANGVVVTDRLDPNTTFTSASGAACNPSGGVVTCDLGALAPGASSTVTIVTKVSLTAPTANDPSTSPEAGFAGTSCPATGTDLCNRVSVTGVTSDPSPANNAYVQPTNVVAPAPPVPPVPGARHVDLHLVKTASDLQVETGGTLGYTLTVRNVGPDSATAVTLTDPLPSGVAFVSADPGCTLAGGTVRCVVGTLAAGATAVRHLTVTVTADPGPPTTTAEHDLDIQKVESFQSLQGGQTADLSLSCAAGAVMVDAMPTVDAVDQGTGGIDQVRVLAAASDPQNAGRYTFRVSNGTTGQAQLHLFGVCVAKQTTAADGHVHTLSFSDPIVQSAEGSAGRHDATVTCPAGTAAVAPGYRFTQAAGDLVRSEGTTDGSGWDFGYVLDDQAQSVELSVRCLDTTTSTDAGHAEQLALKSIDRVVTVAPSDLSSSQPYVRERVTCPDGSKGIVGTYDLPPNVRQLGSSPQPINRDFVLLNTGATAQEAHLDLLCLGIRVGGGKVAGATITNRASVSAAESDLDPSDNVSQVTVAVTPRTGASVAGPSTLLVSLRGASIRVACAAGGPRCAGRLTVSNARNNVVAVRRYEVAAGRTASLKVSAKALKGLRRATLRVTGAKASKTVNLKHR